MSQVLTHELEGWVDRGARTAFGERIGVVTAVHVDARTGRPTWLTISVEPRGTRNVTVPVLGASELGGDIVVAYSFHTVISAPFVENVERDVAGQRLVADHYSCRENAAGPHATPAAPG